MYTEHLRTGHFQEGRFRFLFANEPMALMMVGETCPLPFIVMLSAGVDESQSIHACMMHISMYTYFITQHLLNMPKELRADADVADPRLMVSPSSNHAPYGRVRNPILRSIPGRKKCDTRLARALRDRCIMSPPPPLTPHFNVVVSFIVTSRSAVALRRHCSTQFNIEMGGEGGAGVGTWLLGRGRSVSHVFLPGMDPIIV